jgi:pyrimidine operon attenuation protein/uracil phosphoribosyltransferase
MDKVRSENAVDKAMAALITQVSASYQKQPLVVGIHTGGAWVAKAICKVLDWGEPATLDISLYRDDFATTGLRCSGSTKGLPTMLNGEQILLVDDVLYTGRTIRAALNVLFDYGRPGNIDLAVLFDRGGRELPFEPKFLGEALGEDGHGRCKLIGPEPLVLVTPILE